MPKSREKTLEQWRTFAAAHIKTGSNVEAAKAAGYKGKTNAALAAHGSRLLARPEVKAMIKELRAEIKAMPVQPIVPVKSDQELVCEQVVIDTQAKRAFLWGLAKECGRVDKTEEVEEEISANGVITRTIRVTERVFKPREAIEAITVLNEMDGDVAPSGKNAPPTGSFSIEQAILNFGR